MKRVALGLLPVLFACLSTIGCGDESSSSDGRSARPTVEGSKTPGQNGSSSGGSNAGNDTQGTAQQAIQEADIIQLQDGHLFAISKSGTLSIIDVSKPGQLTLNSQVFLPGEPFEMYLNGNRLVLLMNKTTINPSDPNGINANANANATSAWNPNAPTSAVLVLNVQDPVLIQRLGTFGVTGAIQDSRLAGETLYLVTENGPSGGDNTFVTTFDLSAPSALSQVDQLALDGAGSHSVIFGNGRMYVGGDDGIDLVDVSDPKGKLEKGTHVDTAGPIDARWQMSEKDEVLRVVTQADASSATVETFAVWNARSMQPMATADMQLPRPEELKAVRFDEDRAYFITFRQTDPLFIVDLSDPMNPQQRGELVMPGWVVHLEPRGNRLIGLGVDPSNSEGTINVSLFDVSNLDAPRMIQRVNFGATTELAEDQDRLQKAFRIGSDGLITVPYAGPTGSACESGGAIQLVKLDNDTLYKGQSLPMAGNPRRALANQNELVAVSDSNVSAFDIATATKTADVTIGTCEIRTATVNDGFDRMPDDSFESHVHGDDTYYDDGVTPFGCTTTPRNGSSTSWATVVIGLGAVVGGIARRRASRQAA